MCDSNKEPSLEELKEAKRQIDSILHKLEKTIQTLESKENPQRLSFADYTGQKKIQGHDDRHRLIEKQMKNI